MERKRYAREFNLEAVRLVKARGVFVAQASRDLGVHANVLREWVRAFAADPEQGFIQLYRWFPSVLKTITIVRPETVVRWHRAGFRRYWRWKSRSLGGRPQIDGDIRALIRRMSVENPLWGSAAHPRRVAQARL